MKKYYLLLFLLICSSAFGDLFENGAGIGSNVPFGYNSFYQSAFTTFNASSSHSVDTVEVWILKEGAPVDTINVSLWNVVNGIPTTRVAMANSSLSSASVTASYAPYNFTFSNAQVSQGSMYAILINTTQATDDPNFFRMEYGNGGGTNFTGYLRATDQTWVTSSSVAIGHYNIYGSIGNFIITGIDAYDFSTLENVSARFLNRTFNQTSIPYGNYIDWSNHNKAVLNSGTVLNQVSGTNYAADFDGVSTHVNVTNSNFYNLENLTVMAWVNPAKYNSKRIVSKNINSTDTFQLALNADGTVGFYVRSNNVVYRNSTLLNVSLSNWTHIAATFGRGEISLYVNGVNQTKTSSSLTDSSSGTAFKIGVSPGGTSFFNGSVDDVIAWNRTLTSAEINSYMGRNLPFDSNVYIPFNIPFVLNITISSNDTGGYFNRTYLNYNTSMSLQANLTQAEILLIPRTFITNTSISGGYFTSGSQSVNNGERMPVKVGNLNFSFIHPTYAFTTTNFTISALGNTSEYFYVGDSILNISANNGVNGSKINVFNISLLDSVTGIIFTDTTTSGNIPIPVIQNRTYNVTIMSPGYASKNVLIIPNTTLFNYNFSLFPFNSIFINIFDEDTGARILQNVTLRFSTNNTQFINVTNTSIFFIEGLYPDTYTINFNSSGYTNRNYVVTVGNLSNQYLNAFLSQSSLTTLFTITDSSGTPVLENVLSEMSRFINGSYQIVQSQLSDVTGKAQFSYTANTKYRFCMSKTGYTTNCFFLDPILFSTYDIKLTRSSVVNFSEDFTEINVLYSPSIYQNNQNQGFEFFISSPTGLLTQYGYTLTYPGGTNSNSSNNAIGSQLSSILNIVNATTFDTVQLDYFYITSLTGRRNFTLYLPIETNSSNPTFISNRNNTYGMGILERVLIATIIILGIVGIASVVGQILPGLGLGMFVLGYMVYIGFLPFSIVGVTIFLGVMYLFVRGGG